MGMAAILINGPFVKIFNPPLTEGSSRNLKKIGLGVSEKLFKCVDGRTTDGRRVITIAHPEPSAQVSLTSRIQLFKASLA